MSQTVYQSVWLIWYFLLEEEPKRTQNGADPIPSLSWECGKAPALGTSHSVRVRIHQHHPSCDMQNNQPMADTFTALPGTELLTILSFPDGLNVQHHKDAL